MNRLAALLIAICFVAVACAPEPAPTPVDCSAAAKPYLNLGGCDLSGRDFSGANLYGANLRSTNLTDSVFVGADLTSADLSYAILSGAEFGYVESGIGEGFPPADLDQADMSNTIGGSFWLTEASGVDFSGATGLSFGMLADFRDTKLVNAELSGVGAHASVSGDFSGANLSGVGIWKSSLRGNFTGADLTNVFVVWFDGDLHGNFTNADLTGSNITGEDSIDSTWFNTTCPNGIVQSTPC
jgi:uncharacterized protein YjbI with pentapeptide repeats